MGLYETRPRGCGWNCNGCRASHKAKPGFKMYTCVPCDQDWCPNCFAMVMQNRTTLKSAFMEDK